MLDRRGFVAETNATHLLLVEAGRLATPTTAACPEGITRATVLELCAAEGIEAREADLSLTEFYRADEVFCTGTMGELAPVSRIDGRPIGSRDGQPGVVTLRRGEAYGRLTREGGEPVLGD